jgi:gliding motility-associated-like protein
LVETIFIEVFQDVPQPVIEDTIPLCQGESVQVIVGGGQTYDWAPNQDINVTTGPMVTISTPVDRWYYVGFTNPCGTVPDSVFIDVIEVDAQAGNDTIVCPGEPVNLWASGGVTYSWTPASLVTNPLVAETSAQSQFPTNYSVTITDQFGCVDSAFVVVDHYPLPFVQASPDYYGFPGDEIILNAEGNDSQGDYVWSPAEYLSCVNCQSPTAMPPESITYEVMYIDGNGCRASDDVTIHFEGIIYVPNTFTPDGNSINDFFAVEGGNIEYFNMLIFNRWGEVVFETNDFDSQWDGTYNGQKCKDGTYIWKIRYEDTAGNREEIVGHVNLLR